MSDPKSDRPNPFYRPALGPVLRRHFIGLMAATFGWTLLPAAESEKKPKGGGGGKKGSDGYDSARARGPAFVGDYALPAALAEYARVSVVLGRPTDVAMTFSVLAAETIEGYIEIGEVSGQYTRRTPLATFPGGTAVEVEFSELKPNTQHHYRLCYRAKGATTFTKRAECRFATQRAPGSTFVFTVQGDSHPERAQSSHPELYARTLQAAAADKPDFHLCIGDDFSVDKVRTVSREALAAPYLLQRPFLGLVGQHAAVMLLNGNHEQGSLFNYNQTDERHDVAVGVQLARNRLYPLPKPGKFYSGNTAELKDIGLLRDYCAWTWGDALFVLLDNYWHSPALVDSGFGAKNAKGEKLDDKKNRDWWGITIGDAQYQWLKRTLETSKARHKFVFAHHVLGSGRGGVDVADLYEWGGQGRRGESFAEKRPGWESPIHQLMAKHKVSIFFQGHDHLYCQQAKDGVIYQELPMPSDHGYVAYNDDRYASGTKLPSSGHLRVTVSPDKVKVEYVRSFLPKDETPETRHGAIAHSYEVKAKG